MIIVAILSVLAVVVLPLLLFRKERLLMESTRLHNEDADKLYHLLMNFGSLASHYKWKFVMSEIGSGQSVYRKKNRTISYNVYPSEFNGFWLNSKKRLSIAEAILILIEK